MQQHRSSTVARAESEDSTAPASQSNDAATDAAKQAAALYDRSFPKTGLFSIADPNAEVTLVDTAACKASHGIKTLTWQHLNLMHAFTLDAHGF